MSCTERTLGRRPGCLVGGYQIVDSDGNPITVTNPFIISDNWRISLVSDETLDDNDKTVITVPTGEEIQILWIWVEFVTTATVGNRQLAIQIQDSDSDIIGEFRPGIVQAASLTRYYMFGCALADMGSFRDTDYLSCPIAPTLILSGGNKIRIYDNNNVDSDDDLIVQIQVATREI
jgi:hypothetical protein